MEPILSAEIMQVHHDKHHATYVNGLNQAEEKVKEALAKGLRVFHIILENEVNRLPTWIGRWVES